MTGYAGLAACLHEPSEPGRPRNPHLGHENRTRTNFNIVGDLHKIIDPDVVTDDRVMP